MQEMQEKGIRSLGGENFMEEEMATHSSILAWRNPRTEEPGALPSMDLQRDSMRTQSHPSLLLTQFSFPSFLQQRFPRFYVLRQGSFSSYCKKKKKKNSNAPLHLITISTPTQLHVLCGLSAAHHTTCSLTKYLVHLPVTSVVYICMTVKASSY